MVTKQQWVIEGERTMHCAGCAQTIQYSLKQLPNVQSVVADYRTQRVYIETTDSAISNQISSELASLGYTARQVTDE